MLLSQRNSKTQSFLNKKLRYSSETELINNFDKKSQFRFDCKNTTFCEHHKYKQWIPNLLMLWLYGKHLSGVVSNLKPVPQYCFMITSCTHLIIFPLTQQNENENCLWAENKRKLNRATNKFSNAQNHKKSYSTTTFRIIFTFSPTEINRTPRSLL